MKKKKLFENTLYIIGLGIGFTILWFGFRFLVEVLKTLYSNF